MFKFLLLFCLIFSSGSFAASTRTIDADFIRSSDGSKTYTLPASSGTLVLSGNLPIASQFQTDSFNGNGSTTNFTLTYTPASNSEVKVFQNGLLMTITTDYTISGTTLTMTTAPVTGQKLQVIYSRY